MDIETFVAKAKKKDFDIVRHTQEVLEDIKKINKEHHFLLTISEDLALEQANTLKKKMKGSIAGVPITVKDCICVTHVESRAGSAVLEGYKPVIMATAVQKLIDEGAIIVGKTTQDEFGFGSFNINTGNGIPIPLNPVDKKRACGGSSGGSGGITKKLEHAHASLGESTGGSIVAPASFCGAVGLCPTYGRVSRYGLIDYANSLDKIGPLTKTVAESALILEIIAGKDPKDSTSADVPVPKYTDFLGKDIQDFKIGIITESMGTGVDEKVQKQVMGIVNNLKKKNIFVKNVSLPITHRYGISCYYLIAMAEASTNLAKYCGLRYGKTHELKGTFNEFFTAVRSEAFGAEVKRRIIIGTFARMAGYRDAYYLRAMKVRTKIIEEYTNLFKHYDVLISPTMPMIAPTFEEIKTLTPAHHYAMDVLTVGPNLAGLPHISVNISGEKELPIGLMIIGKHFDEGKIIQLASHIEKMI